MIQAGSRNVFISIPQAVAGPEPAMPPPNLLSFV